MRVGLYLRVSKDKVGAISIDVQRDACMYLIRERALTLVREYVDDGVSAYTDRIERRPAFQRLLADARAGLLDVVLVYKYDRFARRRRVYFGVMDELRDDYGIEVTSATESGDWLSVGVTGLMAEQYSRMLSARMKDVRRWEVKHRGLHVGRVPVGYERSHGMLTPDERAPVVLELGQLYVSGQYSAVRLAETLNRRGHTMPDGTPWMPTAIKDILANPVYAGMVTIGGETYRGAHESIWSTDLWEQIQEMRKQRSYVRGPERAHFALLTGLVVCSMCGNRMSYHPQSSGLRYYRCQASARRQVSPLGLVCRARGAYADEVEQTTLAWLSGLSAVPDLVAAVERHLQEQRPAGPSRADLEARLKRLARAYADGAYTDAEYDERRADIIAKIDQHRDSAPPIDLDAARVLLSDLPGLFAEATDTERQTIVRQLIGQVYVYRDQVRAIRPTRAAELFFQAAAQGDDWLKSAAFYARSASDENTHKPLTRTPLILCAA